MEIQRLDPTEGRRLREIRLRTLRDAPEAFGSTYEDLASRPPESWRQRLEDLPTFVAVADGRDVGVVRCAPDKGPDDTAWLISMWVEPAARGKGVGEALIDEVAGHARSRGARRLLLEVAEKNLSAIALYTRKGFRPTGETKPFPPPRQHLLKVEYELDLS
jgi:ribosomal protein S18 acetylase RimI-like enzyme